MKNIMLFFALTTFAITAMAQGAGDSKEQNVQTKTVQQQPAEKKEVPPNEYVKMTEGKVWHYVGTAKTEITGEKQVKLGETIVKADGTVVLKDGTTAKLKEGNVVNKQGRVIDVAVMKQKAAEQRAVQQKSAEQKSLESQPKGE